MNGADVVESLREAVAGNQWERARQLADDRLRETPGLSSVRLALAVGRMACANEPPAKRGQIAQDFVIGVEKALGRAPEAKELVEMGRFLHTNDRPYEASRYWSRAFETDRNSRDSLHALGLAELARALATPLGHTESLVERWRRAWSCLSVALMDRRFFRMWVADRLRVYGADWSEDVVKAARERILEQVLGRLAAQAESSATTFPATAVALRRLMDEFRGDFAGMQVFDQALEHVDRELSADIPLPFGLIWFRGCSSAERRLALESLRAAVDATSFVPWEKDEGGNVDSTIGRELRQWYSRLAAARNAVKWGHFEEAEAVLRTVCGACGNCGPNPLPHFRLVFASPKCCDPEGQGFANCNPGYAVSEAPAFEMESDAHRLGIFIQLARAGSWLALSPPEHHEAARHWALARSMAQVVSEQAELEESVTTQVLGVIFKLRQNPSAALDVLKAATGAVPSPVLRGRFANQLANQGIDLCNQGKWDAGVYDLRLAWSLNKDAERTARNLAVALQNLVYELLGEGRVKEAANPSRELIAVADHLCRDPGKVEEFGAMRAWAEEMERNCREHGA